MTTSKLTLVLGVLALVLSLQSCKNRKVDESKITMRPKIYMEGASPIPLFEEYDMTSVQLGTVQNILSEKENDRVFALWLVLDRRSAFFLQKETAMNLGRRFQLVSNDQVIGIHPIEATISNGILPFLLSPKLKEEEARFLHAQLSQSLLYLQAELSEKRK